MINHLRSLLLDLPGSSAHGPDYPGEEYVPPDFVPRPMPGSCRTVWRMLFGVDPDRAMRNYRLFQLLACVHATEVAEFALEPDGRITYATGPARLADFARLAAFGATAVTPITLTEPTGDDTLQTFGTPAADEARGRLVSEWRVEIDGGDLLVDRSTSPPGRHRLPLSFSGDLSGPVELPGPGSISVRVRNRPGSAWSVRTVGLPGRSLGAVIAAVDAGGGTALTDVLNGPDPEREPDRTLRQLWSRTDFLPHRAAALAVALGRRIEESRG